MDALKKQPIRKLRKPAEILKLNPERNPYSTRIFEYADLIWFDGVESARSDLKNIEFLHGPLVVDLGCGSGNFLRQFALRYPEKRFLGFELRFKRLVFAAKKLKKGEINNVRLIRSLAEVATEWIRPGSVELLHVNFPDPWPKKKHRKNRLIQPAFLETLHQLLMSQGRFVFKTDHQEYFQSSLEFLQGDSRFEVSHLCHDLHQSEIENIPTEFELLFKSQGLPVYYVELQKI